MRTRLLKLITTMVLLSACASRAPAPTVVTTPEPVTPRAAPPLSYSVTAPVTLTYQFADTTTSDIQAGPAGSIQVKVSNRGTAEMGLQPAGSDLQASITIREFTGEFNNSAGGAAVTATATDARGSAVVNVTPRGVATITQRPELTQAFRATAGSDNVWRRFFIRLPGRTVRPGATWTDTIATEEVNEGLTSKMRNIVRSTYVADTTVNGRRLNVVFAEGDRNLDVSGSSQGVEIVQKLSGKTAGRILWDPQRNVIVSRDETASLSGTFDLPAMGMTNMVITASSRFVLRLVDG